MANQHRFTLPRDLRAEDASSSSLVQKNYTYPRILIDLRTFHAATQRTLMKLYNLFGTQIKRHSTCFILRNNKGVMKYIWSKNNKKEHLINLHVYYVLMVNQQDLKKYDSVPLFNIKFHWYQCWKFITQIWGDYYIWCNY